MLKFKSGGIIKQSVKMSLQNIIGNKMRSFLTVLGVIIGVMAVISLITIVQSATDEMMSNFEGIGAGNLTVNANGTVLQEGLTSQNIEDISNIENVKYVSPEVSLSVSAVRNSEIAENVSVTGVNEDHYLANDIIGYGRRFYPSDMAGDVYVCIADKTLVENLFVGVNPIGQEIILGGYTYKIIGVESDDSGNVLSEIAMGTNDGSVKIPYKNALKMSSKAYVNTITVYVDDTDLTDATEDALEAELLTIFDNDDDSFSIVNLTSLLDMMNTVMSMMTGILAGIASISLLVGGIGIMNMMLVSVTERTKEIGLRKALGATPGRIQLQFLIEAFILSVAGGIVGLILGLVVSAIIASVMGVAFSVSPFAIQLGVGFSAAVGIIFGWAPARKASRLSPIDALRSE